MYMQITALSSVHWSYQSDMQNLIPNPNLHALILDGLTFGLLVVFHVNTEKRSADGAAAGRHGAAPSCPGRRSCGGGGPSWGRRRRNWWHLVEEDADGGPVALGAAGEGVEGGWWTGGAGGPPLRWHRAPSLEAGPG